MTDHRTQVDQLLAEYRQSKEQLVAVQRTLTSVVEAATSPDGVVSVSVGPHGGLLDLRIADSAYQRYRPAELSALIVRTTAEAAARAVESARAAVLPVLPEDTDPAVLLGAPDTALGAANVARPAPVPCHDELEESLEDHSWMEESSRGRPL
ncbi:MAG: YbaB/EbfC family nucleoid-associated protein [Sciscionella sp.]